MSDLPDERTPLHLACNYNQFEIVGFLASEDYNKKLREGREAKRKGACLKSCDDDESPSYNIENAEGRTPLSYSRPGMLELLLQLEDIEEEKIPHLARMIECHLGIEVVDGRGRPLPWECVTKGLLTETIARDKKLRGQFGNIWAGTLPLEEGGDNDVSESYF